MGRSKKRNTENEQWGYVQLLFSPVLLLLSLLVNLIKFAGWFFLRVISWLRKELYLIRVKNVSSKFRNTLLLRKSQLVLFDQYGINLAEWEKEKRQFIKRFLEPCPSQISIHHISAVIDKELKRFSSESNAARNIVSPTDYEVLCAELLEKSGWQTLRTPMTGDQGVDIIATKNGINAVFQCKWYSQPVGNKAIQEVLAGKLYQEADVAAVLTNAPYTTSASQLAGRTGVHLLHHSQIADFTNQLQSRANSPMPSPKL